MNNFPSSNFPLSMAIIAGLLAFIIAIISACTDSTPKFEFKQNDNIAYVGNALAERKQYDGWLETYLQITYSDKQLTFRNLGFTGDQVHHRPRSHEGFGDPDTHLTNVGATVIFAFFGYNESFDEDPEAFSEELEDWINHTQSQRYDNETPPRIVLFSPIAHENLEDPNLPNGLENNRRLEAYTNAMAEVSRQEEVLFVDLFNATKELYERNEVPLTINGIHLHEKGNQKLAGAIVESLSGAVSGIEKNHLNDLREAVLDKNWHWFNRYRAASGNDIWGTRSVLHGNAEVLQHELKMLDIMTQNRDSLIWAIARGQVYDVDDSNVPSPIEVESNIEETQHIRGHEEGVIQFHSGEEAIEMMRIADGLEINLFASEDKFPEIANPRQILVHPDGDIWVAAWATYPKWEPLTEMNDRLVVLTDTSGNGVADVSTTFAEVQHPTGFEFWNGGVLVGSAPNILFLKDTTGDGKADVRITFMGGLDSGDTHTAVNHMTYGPDGWIYYQRGIFMLSNLESPWRMNFESDKMGIFRFNPRTFQVEFVSEIQPNPHGMSFDRWGNLLATDATTGEAYHIYFNSFHQEPAYLEQDESETWNLNQFESRRLLDHTVRPVPSSSILSSQHFPDEYENNFLIFNTMVFQGIKRYGLQYNNDEIWGEEIGNLIDSDDPNFRPTSGVIGDDGAFYISDWHNPTIGHMQHNLRDPVRDHDHGRIYRITAEGRPLQEPVSIHGQTIGELLELLKHPVNQVRHRVRIELSGRDTDQVIQAAQSWASQFNVDEPSQAHAKLEALWLHQQHNVKNNELLGELLASPVDEARIAAQRVDFEWRQIRSNWQYAGQTDLMASAADEDAPDELILDFSDDEIAEFKITTLVDQMRFDVKEFTVRVGQQVELLFENPDAMPHNLLITTPGTVDEVYRQAIDLGAQGFEKQFIPDTPDVFQASNLLNRNEQQMLRFAAPSESGEYSFICTFPGHGEMMRGVMKVVN